ncbi:uncharacterized protein TRIADDRAFT_61644 [Trichoplax adhaerens]|uniref:Protein phosphatase 1 regulatory subunit 15A/B C-terminal domain-containing protein n=1 Tax=Trichoplax adhaerens TaxID=10228 RepID=B3SBK1_TRIAD|nr:predicted protein [Trichoplax adhaerens]EDV19872.1 predicted protein [Trichoplax adhaerens]|eukprot:XP_002117614.1 predicted protein [Trichoplax adhaerens]
MGLGDLRHDDCSEYDPLMSHCYKSNGTELCRCDSLGYHHQLCHNHDYNGIGPPHQRNSGSISPSSIVDGNSDDSDDCNINSHQFTYRCIHCPHRLCNDSPKNGSTVNNNLLQLENEILHCNFNAPEMLYPDNKHTNSNINYLRDDNPSNGDKKFQKYQSTQTTNEMDTLLLDDYVEIIIDQNNFSHHDNDHQEDTPLTNFNYGNDRKHDHQNTSVEIEKATNSDEELRSWSDVSDDDDDDDDNQSPEALINHEEQQEIWESFATSSLSNRLTCCTKSLNNGIISVGERSKKENHQDYRNKNDSQPDSVNKATGSSRNVIGLDSRCKLKYEEKMKLREKDNHNWSDDDDSSSPSRPTRVHFKPGKQLEEVHLMVTWNFAYRAARKATWCQYRIDHIRFLNRIKKVEEAIRYVFQPQHREKMLQYITLSAQ